MTLRAYLPQLKRTLTKKDRSELSSEGVVVRYVNSHGVARMHGGPKMKSTQTYTQKFGRAVAALHKKYTLKIHLKSEPRRLRFSQHVTNLDCLTDTWPDAGLQPVSRFIARRAAHIDKL